MKFFKLFLFSSLFLFSGVNQSVFAEFSDVLPTNPHYEAILYVQSESIVSGYPDGTYKSYQSINRAEFTKIIVGAVLGSMPEAQDSDCFPDVFTVDWFQPYVCYAKQEGIIGGYPDGTFKPTQEISFAEAAKIVVGAFGYFAVTTDDVWFRPFVEALELRGAIPDSIVNLTNPITRGDLAEIVYRLRLNIAGKHQMQFEENFELTIRNRSEVDLMQDLGLQTLLLAAYEKVRKASVDEDYETFQASLELAFNLSASERAEIEASSEAELEMGFHDSIEFIQRLYSDFDESLIIGMKRKDDWAAIYYKEPAQISFGDSTFDLRVRFFHLVNNVWVLNGYSAAHDISSDIVSENEAGIRSRLLFNDEESKIRYLLALHEFFFLPNEFSPQINSVEPYSQWEWFTNDTLGLSFYAPLEWYPEFNTLFGSQDLTRAESFDATAELTFGILPLDADPCYNDQCSYKQYLVPGNPTASAEAILEVMSSEPWITVHYDTAIENGHIISFTEGQLCGGPEALVITSTTAFRFYASGCGEGSEEFFLAFDHIVDSVEILR